MWSRIDTAFRASAAGRWFGTLEPNERSLVTGLAAFLVIAILYLAVWSPLSDWSHHADAQYQRQMAVLDWMRQNEKALREKGKGDQSTPDSGSLLTLVANSAARSGIQLLRYQPEGGGGVSVVLQNQSFNTLIGWLADLAQNHVSVKQISIDDQNEPGMVNARISLI